ncbi:MAG TPA: DinB family protein [Kouleothrix sp.]|uniref:DinB family protein n=1 Tax=Kouleothrix sp. TaxID=2779161 RepID=UPI002D17FCAA|nr:DinB family protein [Kouleothrix sp.]HRC76654.1 DinB family protein [Kouleothrix sp.]
MPTAAERQALIAKIRALPEQIAAICAELSDVQLTTRFLAGEWSVAQNVHHLADSHMNAYVRCKLIATEDHPTLKPYDQDRWAELSDAQGADVSASLALLRALHARWVAFWEALPGDAWPRAGLHPENGEVSLDDQLRLYAAHGEGHIDQIRRTLAAQP